jgi:SnoaL-like domain
MSNLQRSPAKSAIRVAMEARNTRAIVDAFAPDAVFHSPLTEKLAFKGRKQIAALTDVILEVFTDFRYTDELFGENTAVLVSRAQVDGIEIEMVDHIRLGPDGKIEDFTVFMRPLPAAAAALRLIGARFGRRKSLTRAALISALASPLAFMTRMGDGIGVRLIRSAL